MNPQVLFRVVRTILDSGAWGVLWHLPEQAPICVTLEHTYETGKRIKLPDGVWYCTRRIHGVSTGKGYPAWEIHIPGHRYIDIHIANFEDQLEGCLGLGEMFAVIDGKRAIGASGSAFKEFMSLTEGLEDFFIEVKTQE